MDQLQLDKSLQKIEYTFRWTGMNLESSRKTRSENLKYKFVYFFNFIWMNTDLAGAVWWFIDSAMKGASFTSLTYGAPCITMCFLANTKSIFILIYQDYINKILSILRNLEINHRRREKIAEKEEIILKETGFLFLVLKSLNFFNWSLLIAFPLMTLYLMAIEYYHTKELTLKMPFQIKYPFDAYDIKYYPWVFLKLVWGTVVVIIETSGVDYLFYVCIAFICIQFKLLQHDIRTIVAGDRYPGDTSRSDLELHEKIVELVKWHQELIHAVELMEVLYSKSILFHFGTSSLLICLSGFNVLTIDDKPYIVSFASFLFSSLLQIFSVCYFGDMLMRSSIEVSDAIYNSKWYQLLNNVSIAKDFKTMHMRALKPCKLTAFGFADVNLKAFTKILSTSWSYFAFIRTVYASPRA